MKIFELDLKKKALQNDDKRYVIVLDFNSISITKKQNMVMAYKICMLFEFILFYAVSYIVDIYLGAICSNDLAKYYLVWKALQKKIK